MSEIVIITGASRGIGAATARLLGAKGFSVVVNYSNSEAAALEVVADVERSGGRAIAVKGDVGNEADVIHLLPPMAWSTMRALWVRTSGALKTWTWPS